MRYNVTIQETLARTVQVEAGTQREAELAVSRLYRDSEIVLSSDDYVATRITANASLCKSPSGDFSLCQGDYADK